MSTGSATNVGDKKESDLSAIIAELRSALGGVPEVAKLYGKPEGAPSAYDALDLRDDVGDVKDAYSSPELELNEAESEELAESKSTDKAKDAYNAFNPEEAKERDGLRAEQSKSAYSKVVLKEEESSESESKDSDNYISDLKLNPEPPKTPIAKESESKESESSKLDPYVSDFSQVQVPKENSAPVQPSPVANDVAANYTKVRKETDQRLARLAKFLPDKVREKLDRKFEEATKLAQPKSDDAYKAATEALIKLQSSLDAKAPELRTTEANFLRKQIKDTLDSEGGTLLKDDKKGFIDRFATLDKDLPAEEDDAKTQLESLQKLAGDIDGAIKGRLKAISDLCVDYERLVPIVQRALSIEGDKHVDLEKANSEIKSGFEGKFANDGLTVEEIRAKVTSLEKIVHDVFKNFTVDDALVEQKGSLPASPASLKPNGPAIGSGAFGEVFQLDNDGSKKLVGKSFPAGNADARKEMEHEAEIYAHIGEHPNIAQCYGIQDVEGSSMLVMDMIEGKNVEKVFDDLNERYRDAKLSQEEYLAATQHLIKGTLTGLAHMEAMGLVHKDIKGDNVKFDTRTNQAVLIDMGMAQAEGDHLVPKAFTPIAPPENFALKKGDTRVTTFWDSFTVGKMLFEEMERNERGKRQVLVTGSDQPIKKHAFTQDDLKLFGEGARAAAKRTASGEVEAVTDAKGQLVGQALKSADSPDEAAQPGRYGAATQYVDFMNRLTHPDPKQRLTPSEALKHPFMTDAMLSGEQLDKVFGKPTDSQPKEEKKSKPESSEDEDEEKGPRIDTDKLAAAYSGKQSSEDDLDSPEDEAKKKKASKDKKKSQ